MSLIEDMTPGQKIFYLITLQLSNYGTMVPIIIIIIIIIINLLK